MDNDEIRNLFEEFLRRHAQRVRYCQRCEEPRTNAEFPPFKLGVCIHCLNSMRPGELRELLPNGISREGEQHE